MAIDENNDIWLDKRVIDPRAIKANIARMRAETPDGEVIVQADIESNAETLMKVVDALKEAGIPLPTVSTKSE